MKWMNEKSIEELNKSRKTRRIVGLAYVLFGSVYILLGCCAFYLMGLGVTGIISIIVGSMAALMGDSMINSCERISILIYLKEMKK